MTLQPKTPPPVSPFPVLTPIDIHNRAAVVQQKDEFYREQLVRAKETKFVREKLKWCYMREGVNHLKNCRDLALQYAELMNGMKDGWFKGYKPVIKE